jgi:hypothetical protein
MNLPERHAHFFFCMPFVPKCQNVAVFASDARTQAIETTSVSYAQGRHPSAYTSQEIAQLERIPGEEFAKTVILKADDSEKRRTERANRIELEAEEYFA